MNRWAILGRPYGTGGDSGGARPRRRYVPAGTGENSPPFQRWDGMAAEGQAPEGRNVRQHPHRHYAPLGLNHIKPRRGYKQHASTERLPNRVRRHQVAVFLGPLAAW